jgi:tRNA threonylcarbamoyl adenosine modification protein YeaZ
MSLFEEHGLSAHVELVRELAHSQQIVQVFKFMLERLGRDPSDLSAAFAGLGPGSFTGVRIGLSFVNTLSQIQSIPIAGVCSLDLLARARDGWYNKAVTFIRSRKNEVYAAFYRKGVRQTDIVSLSSDAFLSFLEQYSPEFIVAPEDDFRDLGKLKSSFEASNEASNETEVVHAFPSSRSLYQVVRERGLTPEKEYLKPLYIRGI